VTRQEILDQIYASPPEQRAQLYQQYSDIYHRDQVPVPTAEQVAASQDAELAAVRLAALTSNVDWIRKYTAGAPAERAEYEELRAIVAAGADETGMSVRVGDAEVVDALSDPHGVRRSDLFGALYDLNKVGIPEETLAKVLDGDWSDTDYEFAVSELDKLTSNSEWRARLLSGDREARHEQVAWRAIVGSRKVL
jgi:hypothetical protein